MLVAVQLQVNVPATCGNVSACNPPATLSVASCGSTWQAVSTEFFPCGNVGAAFLQAAICSSIPAMNISASPTGLAVAVRSAADPYIAAGNLTGCSYNFGMTSAQYKSKGIGLVVGGILIFLSCAAAAVAIMRRQGAAPVKMMTPIGTETMVSAPSYGQPPVGVAYSGAPAYAQMAAQQPVMMQQAYGQQQQAYPQQAYPQQAYPQQAAYGGQQAYGGMQQQPAYAYAPAQGMQQPQQQWQQPAVYPRLS